MIKVDKDLYDSRINKEGMKDVFEITDKTGRKIRLSKEQGEHIIKEHSAIANKLEEIKETITSPLAIRKSSYDENKRFYYRYYKDRKTAKYLLIIVKYLNGQGFIITSFYTDKIKGQNE